MKTPSTRTLSSALTRALEHASTLVAGVLFASLFAVSLARLFHPYELEWMEGGAVDHVRWLLAGHPLYVRPTLDFIPYIYAPLYFYLATGLCWLVGVGFWPLRLISFAATVATLVVMYRLIRFETASRRAAWLGAAFYAGTFSLCGYWFDLARVDALEIFFLSLALWFVRRHSSHRGAIAAGLCVALGALTKQTALAALLPLGLHLFQESRRRLGAFVATVAVIGGGGFALLDRLNHGWLRYYVLTLPAHHETKTAQYVAFWLDDVDRLLPMGVAVAATAWLLRRGGLARARLGFYGATLVVFLAVSYSSRLHAGGAENVLMPAFLCAALLFAVAIHTATSHLEDRARTAGIARHEWLRVAFGGLTLLQLGLLLYAPWKQIPSVADRRAGDAFIAGLRQLDGDIYLMDHGYYSALAGKRTFAQGMALVDVLRGDRGPVGEQLASELTAAVRERRFGAIVVGTTVPSPHASDPPGWRDGMPLPWLPAGFLDGLQAEYAVATRLFTDTLDFTPLIGWRRRPAVVYVPRAPAKDERPAKPLTP